MVSLKTGSTYETWLTRDPVKLRGWGAEGWVGRGLGGPSWESDVAQWTPGTDGEGDYGIERTKVFFGVARLVFRTDMRRTVGFVL